MKELTNVCKQSLLDLNVSTGIPFLIVDTNSEERFAAPELIKHTLRSDIYSYCIKALQQYHIGNDEILLFYFNNDYFSALTWLDHNSFLLTIPMCNIAQSSFSANAIRSNIIPERLSDFSHFMSTIPPKDNNQVVRFVSLVHHMLCGQPLTKVQVQYNEMSTMPELNNYKRYDDDRREDIPELNLTEEIVEAVASGNTTELENVYRRPDRHYISHMSANPLNQKRYQFVLNISTLVRRLVDVGVPKNKLFPLCDEAIQKMDRLNNLKDIDRLAYHTIITFCELVHDAKDKKKLSSAIALICEYIQKHIYEPIRLEDLEKVTNLNRRTLTMRFKDEMGTTIPKYVSDRKLEEAKYLLTSSEMSIAEISDLLSFSNQSHLTMRFRERFNITPNEYRKKKGILTQDEAV